MPISYNYSYEATKNNSDQKITGDFIAESDDLNLLECLKLLLNQKRDAQGDEPVLIKDVNRNSCEEERKMVQLGFADFKVLSIVKLQK